MGIGISRRQFLKTIGAGVALTTMGGISQARARGRRPNILFIMVDDLGKEWISSYGAEEIKTPHIDALAKGGLRFNCAYSMPQCTPSRATLLTGQYPWRTGWVNHWDVPRWGIGYFDPKRYTTVASLLKNAGYATAAAGKWQINDFRVVPDAMRQHGFDDWCLWTGYETGNPPSGERYWDAYINTPKGSQTHKGKFGPDLYAEFLMDFAERNKNKPMFLYWPMCLTHGPLVHTPDEPNVTEKYATHKAMVRYTDKLVGRVVGKLDELGIRENTIVIFTTDNGSGGGFTATRNGHRVKGGKGKKWEAGVCEPFIVNCPGLVPAGATTNALTDFTDLLPTFVELAGGRVPENLDVDGVSIAPVLLGMETDSKRDWIMALGHGAAKRDEQGVRGQYDYASRVIRDQRFKVWVDTNRTITELYDLQADPWEETNLIASTAPKHAEAKKKFQKIVDWMPARDARPKYRPRASQPWERPFKKK